MIELIDKSSIPISISTTINNLCIFDICNFYDLFESKYHVIYGRVSERPFLLPNILDDKSKEIFLDQIKDRKEIFFNNIRKEISQPSNDEQRKNLSVFLKEFSNRRKLKLDIFPVHFLKWLDLD